MPGVQSSVIGLTDSASVPATSAVSPNTRVKTAVAFVATLADVVQFPGPTSVIGNWVMPALRCRAGGVPIINASSIGIAYSPPSPSPVPTGPMRMNAPDARVSCG